MRTAPKRLVLRAKPSLLEGYSFKTAVKPLAGRTMAGSRGSEETASSKERQLPAKSVKLRRFESLPIGPNALPLALFSARWSGPAFDVEHFNAPYLVDLFNISVIRNIDSHAVRRPMLLPLRERSSARASFPARKREDSDWQAYLTAL
jgi:hypothetical protein